MVVESRWTVEIPACSLPTWTLSTHADTRPDEKQYIDADRPDTHFLTRRSYLQWSRRVAVGLQRAGLRKGDRVLVYSGNSIFFPVVFMGIIMAGGIFTGANPGFVVRELAYQLKDSGAAMMLAADASLDVAVEAAAHVGLDRSRVFAFDTSALDADGPAKPRLGCRHWTELLAPEADAAGFAWFEPEDSAEAICCLNYSSGTTGVPKGVAISHRAYVANGVAVVKMIRGRDRFDAWLQRQVLLCFLPLYHAMAQTYFICNYPHLGMPIHVMARFDFEKMLRNIQRFRVTEISAVPPIVVAVAKHPAVARFDLSSIESIGSGAAPLGPEVCDEVAKRWPPGHLTLRQGWGMTEVTCTSMGWNLGESTPNPTSVGEVMPNAAARLVDPVTGREVTEANARGELWVSTPTMMNGYWYRPDATSATTAVDGQGRRWLKTGDIAYVTEYAPGGNWFIVDRVKELIKVKGNQVAPAELESILLEHPGVVDVGVVGVLLDGEEYPRAYVVPNPAKTPSPEEVAKYMEGKVVRYKWLRGGVRFVKEIPKNPSGKILRRQLRDTAAKEATETQAKL